MAKNYTIESGDSYWDIAAKTWGGDTATINENRKRLQALNGNKRLYAGDSLIIDDTPDKPTRSTSSADQEERRANPKASKTRGSLPKVPKQMNKNFGEKLTKPKTTARAAKSKSALDLSPLIAKSNSLSKGSAPKSTARSSMTEPRSIAPASKQTIAKARSQAMSKALGIGKPSSDERRQPAPKSMPKMPQRSSMADDRRQPTPRPVNRGSVNIIKKK